MSIDRAPAHLADMLGFVRKLRAVAAGSTLEAFVIDGVPWRQIIGLRNILAHGYERIDQETLYRTAATDLAAVEEGLIKALATREQP